MRFGGLKNRSSSGFVPGDLFVEFERFPAIPRIRRKTGSVLHVLFP